MGTEHQEQASTSKTGKTSTWIPIWLGWASITTIGWNTGWIAALLLASVLEGAFELELQLEFAVTGGLFVALGGFVASAPLWLILGHRASQAGRWVSGAGRWVLANGVAWVLAGAVVGPVGARFLFGQQIGAYMAFLFAAGAMVGATQWLVVQDQASKAWLWAAAGAAGWGLGLVLSLQGSYLAMGPEDPSGFLLCFGGGPVAGAITGAAVALCLRRPPSRPVKGHSTALLVGVLWLVLAVAALVKLFR